MSAGATTISDRSGGTIYWGGKYVNIKPSRYSDVIGRRTAVDQMEVTMNNDVMSVKITGPYFFNYVHNLKRTREAPPGDLYISSQGWKVSGIPPYNRDIFEASEGWDYVVSFQNKKVYRLKFSDIAMTSPLPYIAKYRAKQAWRGGYGEVIDDAEVSLADTGLSFIFSVRNMDLRDEIGLHWTMRCGNDVVEGSALVPPVGVVKADPAPEIVDADPIDAAALDYIIPIPAEPLIDPIPSYDNPRVMVPVLAGTWFPLLSSPDHDYFFLPPPEDHRVPEPSALLLLLAGLVLIFCRKIRVRPQS